MSLSPREVPAPSLTEATDLHEGRKHARARYETAPDDRHGGV